jgi:hypothetical protein
MRMAFGLVALLVVMGIVLLLSTTSTQRTLDVARVGVPALREDVAPRPWDARGAASLLERLQALLGEPTPPRAELAEAAATAAGWAAATAPGSRENHVAVKLRSAADELAMATTAPDDPHRGFARRHLDDAAAALAGAAPREIAPIQGIRDQLENLQRSRSEQARELQQ